MDIRRGDVVTTAMHPTAFGLVVRTAKDGSWADVDWGAWSKRMPMGGLIKPEEVPCPSLSGDGYKVTLIQSTT